MKDRTIYKCDLCGKEIAIYYGYRPNQITVVEYDPTASTHSNAIAEYDLCEGCAHEIHKTINRLNVLDQ